MPLSGKCCKHIDDLRADAVVGVEVGADDADGEGRRFARQRFADALGQHRVDLHQLVRVVIENIADGGIDLGGVVLLPRIDLNFELALVGRIGILAVLGAADLFRDAFDAGNRDETLGDLLPDARGLRERNAGAQRGVRNQIIFAEVGQQARAEQRQEHDAGEAAARKRSRSAPAAVRCSQR